MRPTCTHRVNPYHLRWQGSHFFQNIISFGIGYATVDPASDVDVADYAYWDSLPDAEGAEAGGLVRHVRLPEPLEVIILESNICMYRIESTYTIYMYIYRCIYRCVCVCVYIYIHPPSREPKPEASFATLGFPSCWR